MTTMPTGGQEACHGASNPSRLPVTRNKDTGIELQPAPVTRKPAPAAPPGERLPVTENRAPVWEPASNGAGRRRWFVCRARAGEGLPLAAR